MQRASRLKFIILATIACAILFCIAAFSVSFAKWNAGAGNTPKVMQGNAGNFYVEYPQYIAGEVQTPELVSGKYYLQVPQSDNTGTADFYEFQPHTSDNEVKLQSVYLYTGDVLDLFYGKTHLGIGSSGTGENLSNSVITFDSSTHKYTVRSLGEGFYDFYYNYSTKNMWTVFVGKPSEDGGGTTTPAAPERDQSKHSVKVKFSDATVVFQLDPVINGGDTYFYISNNAAAGSLNGCLKMSTGADVVYSSGGNKNNCNSIVVNYSIGDVKNITLFNSSGYHTGAGNTFYTTLFNGLQPNCTYTIKPKDNTWWNDFTSGDSVNVSNYFTVTSSSGGGSVVTNPANNRTAVITDIHGTTDFHNNQSLNSKKTVRQVTSGVQEKDEGAQQQTGVKKYVYKNYICVVRPNSADSTADNTTAYLEFEVADSTVNPYYVKVKSLELKRRATDENGDIKNDFVNPAPRIYNYDQNLDTRLGPDTSDDDASNPDNEGNENRKPLFARGILHTKFESSAGHMKKHYDDGVYAVLYFGDNDQQYFALDIEIELEIPATVTVPDGGFNFTLKAQLANTNSWERYADGYGEPWGFYMGGKINSVETWDPSRTTKLERADDRYVTKYDSTFEKQIVGNVETASDATITAFNKRTDFNYKLIKFFTGAGALEGYARYPKGKIDVSLTVNLTEGSKVKMYMVDHDGHRLDGHTVYAVPSEIVYDEKTQELFDDETYDVYDSDLNIIIPITGTYTFRLVGYFRTRDEESEDINGNVLSGDQICYKDGKRYVDLDGKAGKSLPNFNLFVDTLYITCSSAAEGNSECTVKLDPKGGQFNTDDLREGEIATEAITRTVTFGSDIRNLPRPTKTGATLLGWYYKDEDGNTYSFAFGSAVTDKELTLYAKWAEKYNITFNANGGNLPSGFVNPVQTDEYGNLTKEQWNAATPTREGNYKFLGWFTAEEGGYKLNSETMFTANREIFAQWKAVTMYNVTFNYNGLPGMNNVTKRVADNDTVTAPSSSLLPTYYHVSGWYTDAGCTTAYSFSTKVTSDKTLYAKWYADNGVYVNGERYEFTTKTANVEDHCLNVSITDADVADGSANVAVWYGKELRIPKEKNVFTANANKLISLGKGEYDFYYAYGGNDQGLWISGRFEITFDANGGKFGTVTTKSAYTGEVANKDDGNDGKLSSSDIPTAPTYTDTHYTFGGWNTKADGSGTQYAQVTTTTGFSKGMTLYAQWTKSAFDITFNYEDGTTAPATLPTDNTGKLTSFPEEPTRTGYRFDSWYTAKNGGGNKVTTTGNNTFTEDTPLYANWVEQVTVTFYANGGTWKQGSDPHTQQIDKGSTVTAPPPADRLTAPTGKQFDCWSETNSTSGGSAFNFGTAINGNITLYAQWKDAKYTVTFNANGGTVTPTSAETNTSGQLTSSLPTPTREYHTFDGWYTEADDSGDEVDSTTTFSADQTIYAHWTPFANGVYVSGELRANLSNNPSDANEKIARHVHFNAGEQIVIIWDKVYDGSSDDNSYGINNSYNGYVTESDKLYSVTKDWYADIYYKTVSHTTAADRNTLYVTTSDQFIRDQFDESGLEIGVKIKDGYFILKNDNSAAANATHYAYVSTTQPNNEGDRDKDVLVSGHADTNSITYGTSVITRSGIISGNRVYVNFGTEKDSWTQTKNKQLYDGGRYRINNSTNLEGYTVAKYTITFKMNDGTDTTVATLNTNSSGKLTSLPNNPMRTGFYFGGWFTSSATNATVRVVSTAESSDTNPATVFTGDTTVYAKWQYTVTFNSGDGAWASNVKTQAQQVDIGGHAVVPDPLPTLSGHSITGWYTDTGSKWTFTTDTVSANMTLTAQWEVNANPTHTITFDANGGTLSGSSSLTTDTNGTLSGQDIPTATRDYYDFLGWNTTKTATTAIANLDTKEFNADTPLYAVWKKQTITFKFVSPTWSFDTGSVQILAVGTLGDYSLVTMSGTQPNYTHTFTLDASRGNIIGVKVQFTKTSDGWTAYSTDGYTEYQAGETYTLTFVDWDNSDWNNNRAAFYMTVKNSAGTTITTTKSDIIRINFSDGSKKATLKITYNKALNNITWKDGGIHYFDCTSPSGSPQAAYTVTAINDSNDSCTVIFTNGVGWYGDTRQTNNIACASKSGAHKTYTIKAKSGENVIATVEVWDAELSGTGVAESG